MTRVNLGTTCDWGFGCPWRAYAWRMLVYAAGLFRDEQSTGAGWSGGRGGWMPTRIGGKANDTRLLLP